MSDFRKLAHAVWQCKYHIVWCPKYRFRILKGAVQETVEEIIRQLCEWKKLEILEMKVGEDHVHLVVSIPPKFAVSEAVGFLKGKCAIKIFEQAPGAEEEVLGQALLGQGVLCRHFWAKGYCVSTIGLDEEKIRKYVRWQLEKDRRMEQLKIWH